MILDIAVNGQEYIRMHHYTTYKKQNASGDSSSEYRERVRYVSWHADTYRRGSASIYTQYHLLTTTSSPLFILLY
ncbi:hypothetical protein Leryth_025173 [Lithospermum erythrorhizon]|nr:hypothetical protein Leryth_025173 [Lithospermum erythrorhizon]